MDISTICSIFIYENKAIKKKKSKRNEEESTNVHLKELTSKQKNGYWNFDEVGHKVIRQNNIRLSLQAYHWWLLFQ